MDGILLTAIIGAIVGSIALVFFVGGCIYGWWNRKRQGGMHPLESRV